jgi:tRNA A37 threonylcarbamoyladenosine synthetase subunit TsaC/SUA5/YrdC
MFESLEIRKATNGFILVVHSEDDDQEFVFDTSRKLMRTVKKLVEGPNAKEFED